MVNRYFLEVHVLLGELDKKVAKFVILEFSLVRLLILEKRHICIKYKYV